MSPSSDERAPPPAEQLARFKTCQALIPAGIPFVLWGSDATAIPHGAPALFGTQYILCADADVTAATSVLLEASNAYRPINLSTFGELKDYTFYNRDTPCYFQEGRVALLEHIDRPEIWASHEPQHILVIDESFVHFYMNDPTKTCLNPSPPSSESSQILFPTPSALLDSLIDTFYEPPLPHQHYRWRSQLERWLVDLQIYSISQHEELTDDVACEELPFVDSFWNALEGVKEENRLHLARYLDLPRNYFDEDASAYERFLLKKDRMLRAGLPAPILNMPYCPWRRANGRASPLPVPELESEIRNMVKARPCLYSAFRNRWPRMMRVLSRF